MPVKQYRPNGKFNTITESERQRAFVRADPDKFIEDEAEHLSDYLQNFGIVAAKELILMLAAWLCDPDNEVEAEKHWEQLRGIKR